jgi:ribosome-associated protein
MPVETIPTELTETGRLARRSAALPDEELLAECEVDVFVASGPGGQHRNKTESGVRLRHLPTGVVVTATERRSQLQNRGVALERLREKLAAMSRARRPRRKTRPTRASQRRRLESKRRHSAKKRERTRRED